VIKTFEAQVGQFLLGYICPVSHSIAVVDISHDNSINI
jgi:hypothetical protein